MQVPVKLHESKKWGSEINLYFIDWTYNFIVNVANK